MELTFIAPGWLLERSEELQSSGGVHGVLTADPPTMEGLFGVVERCPNASPFYASEDEVELCVRFNVPSNVASIGEQFRVLLDSPHLVVLFASGHLKPFRCEAGRLEVVVAAVRLAVARNTGR